MMGKKKLTEIKAEVARLLGQLRDSSPQRWLANEIETAKHAPNRDAQTLRMLCAALEREASALKRRKSRRKPAKR